MKEKLDGIVKEKYYEYVKAKLDMLLNFDPGEDEEIISLDSNIRYEEPTSDYPKMEMEFDPYYGPHGDYTMYYILCDGRYVDQKSNNNNFYIIGNGMYVKDDKIYKCERKGESIEKKEIKDKRKIDGASQYVAIRPFQEDRAVIYYRKDGKEYYSYVDTNFKRITLKWFAYAYDFTYGYAVVGLGEKFNVIDIDGNLILKKNVAKSSDIRITPCFIETPNELIGIRKNYGEYKVRKKAFQNGYVCRNSKDKFETSLVPLRIYDSRFLLGTNEKKAYLFDRVKDEYIDLGIGVNVYYSEKDNIIINYKENIAYMIYNQTLIDISRYYKDNLIYRKKFSFKKEKIEIMSYDDFYSHNLEEIDQIFKGLVEEEKERKEKEKKEKELNEILEAKRQKEIKEKERLERRKQQLLQFQELANAIKQDTNEKDEAERASINDIFIEVDDHLEFNPTLIDMLMFIDFTSFSCDNVKMSGIDFRGCNISFDPQKVYNKDLHNSNFEGVHISPFRIFDGVNIIGCKFGENDRESSIEYFNPNIFKNAIYDKTTTFNGKPLTTLIEEEIQTKKASNK